MLTLDMQSLGNEIRRVAGLEDPPTPRRNDAEAKKAGNMGEAYSKLSNKRRGVAKCWTGLPRPPCKDLNIRPSLGNPLTGPVGQVCRAPLRAPAPTRFSKKPPEPPAGQTPLRTPAALPNLDFPYARRWTGSGHPPANLPKTRQPLLHLQDGRWGPPCRFYPPSLILPWYAPPLPPVQ